MKKILVIIYSAFIIIILANIFYYKSLYNRQISYITTVLDHQVQLAGLGIDDVNNTFASNLSEIGYLEDLGAFFNNKDLKKRTTEKLRLFYSKYQDFITGIKIFDDERNEFSLKIDEDEWLEQQFVIHNQNFIYGRDTLVKDGNKYDYYLPIIKNNLIKGNLAVTVDYNKYFDELFSVYNLKNYQWQWVIDNSGRIIYSNSDDIINYDRTEKILNALDNGSVGNLIHKAKINNKDQKLVSSYYSTQLLQNEMALVFSSTTGFFQNYLIKGSFLIIIVTLLLIQAIICVLIRYLRKLMAHNNDLEESDAELLKLFEKVPAGLILYNNRREILMANPAAAGQLSYQSASGMIGKIYPEPSITNVNEYFAKNPGGINNPSHYEIIRKETGDRIMHKNNIPVTFRGNESFLEIITDVTELESARTHEAKANRAKSEFLARLSYEMRTPLTGIIGMTDILTRNKLPDKVKDTVNILQRSAYDLLKVREDILDFSKIETGHLILDEIPFNLRDELNYCSDQAGSLIGEREIIFRSIVDQNVPLSIISDPYRMRQMLMNLITHSVRNTAKGEIQLHCSLLSNENGYVKLGFELQDTGRIFDNDVLKKIFGETLNIESKVLTGNDESGFGPVMASQIIRLMGGELSAENPSGLSGESGTRIRFSIYAYSNDRLQKNLKLHEITSSGKIKTLVITGQQVKDDEILNIIHQLHLNVSVTNYQKSTINQIKANLASGDEKYKMIVIMHDYGFNGFEIAKSLWDNELSLNLIILMISNNDVRGNYIRSVGLAVDHYLIKPVNAADLAKAVRESFPFIEAEKRPEADALFRNGIKALLVEDNKMNQKAISHMLTILGCSIEIAEDGYQGFVKSGEKLYDIIFMDLILPELDGYESARKILAESPDALIVALTADNMPESKNKAELSGIKEFLSKPVRIEDLEKLFEKYFGITDQ